MTVATSPVLVAPVVFADQVVMSILTVFGEAVLDTINWQFAASLRVNAPASFAFHLRGVPCSSFRAQKNVPEQRRGNEAKRNDLAVAEAKPRRGVA
jgi:hypothetical protein